MQNYIHTCYIPHQIYIQIIFANGWVGARRTLACQISGSISIPKERREHWILNTFGAIRLNQPVLVLFAVFHVEKNRFLWGKNSERKHSQNITHASSILVHESSTKTNVVKIGDTHVYRVTRDHQGLAAARPECVKASPQGGTELLLFCGGDPACRISYSFRNTSLTFLLLRFLLGVLYCTRTTNCCGWLEGAFLLCFGFPAISFGSWTYSVYFCCCIVLLNLSHLPGGTTPLFYSFRCLVVSFDSLCLLLTYLFVYLTLSFSSMSTHPDC